MTVKLDGERAYLTRPVVLLLALGAAFGAALPYVVQSLGPSPHASLVPPLLIILGMLLALPVALGYLARGRVDWFSPANMFIGLYGMFWLLRSLYLFLSGRDLRVGGAISHEDFLRGLAWAIVGLGAFYVGYYLTLGIPRSIARGVAGWFETGRVWNRRRMRVGLIALTGLCLAAYALYMQQKGGLLAFVRHWGSKRYVAGSGVAYLKHIGYMLQPTTWFLFIYCHTPARRRGARSLCKVLFVAYACAASLLLVSFGGRGAVIILWVGIGLIRHYMVKRIRTWELLTWLVVTVLAAVAFRSFRRGLGAGSMRTAVDSVGWFYQALASVTRDFSPVDMSYYYFTHVPQALDFLRGSSVTGAFFYLIPRVIWEAKPVHFGATEALIALRPGMAEANTHVAPSIIGDLYLNFSYAGVVVGMLVIGVLFRAAYWYLRDHGTSFYSRVLAYTVTFVVAYWLVKGGMFAALVRPTTSYLLPILMLTRFSTQRLKRRRISTQGSASCGPISC
jgi:oligosaccharide repeat unit polymerase